MRHPASFKERTGQKFGRWFVVEYVGKNIRSQSLWKCRCDCGNIKIVEGKSLTAGVSKSCGCLQKELCGKKRRKHGKYLSTEYRSWIGMKIRCNSKDSYSYYLYGARGIKVCDRWNNSFDNFLKDMGKKPTPKHTLERKDFNGNYEPSNCIWATQLQQQNNKRSNIFYFYNGMKMTLSQLCRFLKVKRTSFWGRIKSGWSLEEAISTPYKIRL